MGRVSFRACMRRSFSIIGPVHPVGVLKRAGGKWSWNGFDKAMAPDGDFIIWEYYGDSESGTTLGRLFMAVENARV